MDPVRGLYDVQFICSAPSVDFLTPGGSNSVMGYACLRPRANDLTLRLRPGVNRTTKGGNDLFSSYKSIRVCFVIETLKDEGYSTPGVSYINKMGYSALV